MDKILKAIKESSVVAAPMVKHSEAPFRILSRRYGMKLAFTPMIHSRVFIESENFRKTMLGDIRCAPEIDRPLIVQFCGSDVDTLVKAITLVKDDCDAVDLNLGCPQNIARRGDYGAFLLEDTERTLGIIKGILEALPDLSLTVKIRILEKGLDETVKFCKEVEKLGVKMITVHGRTKRNLKQNTSGANWDLIRRVKEACSIPVIANGGIGSADDVRRCLETTKADAVMSSVLILENPTIFAENVKQNPFQIAREYIEICLEVSPPGSYRHANQRYASPKGHLFKMLYGVLLNHSKSHYKAIGTAKSFEELRDAIANLQAEHDAKCDVHDCGVNDALVYYNRWRLPERVQEPKKKKRKSAAPAGA